MNDVDKIAVFIHNFNIMHEYPESIRLDGILWRIGDMTPPPDIEPLCPKHFLRLSSLGGYPEYSNMFACEECPNSYIIPRTLNGEIRYIVNKLDSKAFKKLKFVNFDDEAVPLAEEKLASKDGKYFITALLVESKIGKRLILYAGEKGQDKKTQIFVEPDIKRIAFDQKDLHPTDIFLKIEGVFNDGTKNIMTRDSEEADK